MVDPLPYFSFQPVCMTCVTKAVVCVTLPVGYAYKKTLPLIEKSSPYSGDSRFPLSLSEWSLPYVRCHITINKMC